MAKAIKIEIKGDASGAQRAFKKVEKGLGGLKNPIGGLATAMAGAFAVSKIADFAGEMFNLGKDLELQNRKISTVFGENEDRIREWADANNESFGVTETGLANMAAQTADLLKPMGFTADQAADMSQEILTLAPALAEWSGGTHDAAAVQEILNKAMLGETEGLKSLGVSLNAAEIEARALTIAQADGRTEIEATDKALAVQALVMEKSTDAQAAYTGGTDTLAGKQAFLKAKFAEFKEYLATKLMPVFAAITQWAIDRLVPALQRMADRLKELWAEHGPKVTAIMNQVKDAIAVAFNWIKDNEFVLKGLAVAVGVMLVGAFASLAVSVLAAIGPFIAVAAAITALTAGVLWAYENVGWFKSIVDTTGKVVLKVAGFLKDHFLTQIKVVASTVTNVIIPAISSFVSTLGEWIGKAREVAGAVRSRVQSIYNKVRDVVDDVATKMGEVKEAIKAPFREAINWVRDKWNDLKRTLTNPINIPNPVDTLTGWIPGRAMGGTVGMGGPVRVGERGPETVFLPKGSHVASAVESAGSGAQTINVYANTNASPTQIASELAWVLKTQGR